MVSLISAGIAPGIALLSFFYLKDKYESEPILMVVRAFILGAILVFPIMFIQYAFAAEGILQSRFSQSFLLAASLEEYFKWFILYYTIYKHDYFSENYDGIVYAVSVSVGFATVENILYLFANGIETALGRALLPVTSHALFGVAMGFYLGKCKFGRKHNNIFLALSIFVPILLHGIYDYILLTMGEYWLYVIIPFMIFLWLLALAKVKIANKLDQKQL